MQSILLLVVFSFIASLPISNILNWLLRSQTNVPNGTKNNIHFPSNILNFLIKQLCYFFLGFGLIYVSEKLFYFQSDILILIGFLFILSSFFWSIFNKFSVPDYFFFFILGTYVFFSINFLFLIPILFLILSLLTNSIYVGFVCMIASSFIAYFLFDTHYLFLGFNSILLVLSFLRCFEHFTVDRSLTTTFKLRK